MPSPLIMTIIGVALLALFLYVAFLNAWILLDGLRGKEYVPSWIPLFGGVCGAMGIGFLPVDAVKTFWWLPLFLDYGTIPGMLHTIWFYIRGKKNGARAGSRLKK